MSGLSNKADQKIIESMGAAGGKAITDTSATTPDAGFYFVAMQVIAEAVVSAQGDVTGASNPDLTAFTAIREGTILFGKWNSITLTSGEVVVYNAIA